MKYLKYLLGLLICLSTWGIHATAQNIEYGFQQDEKDPMRIKAVAIPSFSSQNVTISTALFAFSLPASTAISPSIKALPARGTFEGHTGSWMVEKLSQEVYTRFGFKSEDLEGTDIYLVTLQDAPELNNIIAGQAIPLFSFELVNDCNAGSIEILTNDGTVQRSLLRSLNANFNNQISLSIDDLPSRDVYLGKNPYSASIACPLYLVSSNKDLSAPTGIKLQPNPAVQSIWVNLQMAKSGLGEIIIYDVQQKQVYRQPESFVLGANEFKLDIGNLAPGSYLLVAKQKDLILQDKFIKIRH